MGLVYKEITSIGRSMYLYYPPGGNRTAFKRCSITVLRDGTDEESVRELLEKRGLRRMAEEEDVILSFPNPVDGRWNYNFRGTVDELHDFRVFQDSMDKADDKPLAHRPDGIPTYEAMMSTWHPMNDTKYLIGIGSGANMACTLAACVGENIAAVLAVSGVLCQEARQRAVDAVMPVCLVDSDRGTLNYFRTVNEAAGAGQVGGWEFYRNERNPLECVWVREQGVFTEELLFDVWQRFMSRVRRTNTSLLGDIEPRVNWREAGFEVYLDDMRLEEKVKTPHTWFTHVPERVRRDGERKVPLLMFFHGGSDNPGEAAEMSKFHELGEREGFITVYPWGTNKTQWNSTLDDPEGADDVGFAVALIRYMVEHYPVDEQRIYLSGFSNGAAHAQVVAMLYPELIAAICHIDSNWPGARRGPSQVDYRDVVPMRLAMEKKQEYDYRMPVWYTYGSRELSYPVYRYSTQQYQYDFWKQYNHIKIEETPGEDRPDHCGCGVPGEVQERVRPSQRHPHHYYDIQRFYVEDGEHENLYNYVVMHDKGHDVAQMDGALGWNYVKQFRRLPDGSLGYVEKKG